MKDIFADAVELPAERRGVFVREQSQDPAVEAEVLRLLEHHTLGEAAVDHPAGDLAGALHGAAFPPGELVAGRFRILREVGEGGMGAVFEAEDTELHTRVALKTLLPHLAANEKLVERFRREVHLARQITHPNVCRVFDLGRHQGPAGETVFLTMEFLDGETLSNRLRRMGRAMTAGEALPLVRQMSAGLDAAHAAGIVHRDFKSGNVMLTHDKYGQERAVVTDFGLSREPAPGDGTGTATSSFGFAIGTPAYMAPEQIEGRPAGPAADLYALGVVVYEMVTGRQPYEAHSPLALAARKVRDLPESPRAHAPGLDARWEAAILRCLALEPGDRFGSGAAVVGALESGRAPVRMPRLPRRGVWAAAAAIVCAAVVAWVLFGTRRAFEPRPQAKMWFDKGVEALGENSFVTAANLFSKAAAEEPEYPLAQARLAEAYIELDMLDRAKDAMLRVAALVPNRSRLAERDRLRLEAALHAAGRDWDQAERAYSRLAAAGEDAFDLGRMQARAAHLDAAIATLEAVTGRQPSRASALMRLAGLYGQKGDARALPLLEKAEGLFRLEGRQEGVTEAMLVRARILESGRSLPESRAELERAFERARAEGDSFRQVRARLRSAYLAAQQGGLGESQQLAEAALAQAQGEGLGGQVANGLSDLGTVFLTHYRFEDAERMYTKALTVARETNSRYTEGVVRLNLASALVRNKRVREALPHLDQGLAFFRKQGYRQPLEQALGIQADAWIELGEFDKTLAVCRELRAMAVSAGDRDYVLVADGRIGHVLLVRGEFADLLVNLEGRRREYEKIGRRPLIGSTWATEAWARTMLGEDDAARAALERVEETARALGESGAHLMFRARLGRAQLAQMRGDDTAALDWAQKATAGASTAAERNDPQALALIASSSCALGKRAEGMRLAAAALDKAGATAPEAVIAARTSMAECLALAGRRAEAEPHARAALDEADRRQFRVLAVWAAAVLRPRAIFEERAAKLTATWPEPARRALATRPRVRRFTAE